MAKAHLMTVLIIDHEGMSDADVAAVIENTRYAYPTVLSHESRDIGAWDDSNPLNHRETQESAVAALFDGIVPSGVPIGKP